MVLSTRRLTRLDAVDRSSRAGRRRRRGHPRRSAAACPGGRAPLRRRPGRPRQRHGGRHRRHQRRRAAGRGLRRHPTPGRGGRGGARRRFGRLPARAGWPRTTAATTWPSSSSAARERWGSSPPYGSACSRAPPAQPQVALIGLPDVAAALPWLHTPGPHGGRGHARPRPRPRRAGRRAAAPARGAGTRCTSCSRSRATCPRTSPTTTRRSGRDLWAYRERHTEAIATRGPVHKLDVAVPVAAVPALVDGPRRALDGALTEPDGAPRGVRLRPPGRRQPARQPRASASATATATTLERLERARLRAGRRASAAPSRPSTASGSRRAVAAADRTPAELAAMRAVKSALDPDGLLNPGVLLPDPPMRTQGHLVPASVGISSPSSYDRRWGTQVKVEKPRQSQVQGDLASASRPASGHGRRIVTPASPHGRPRCGTMIACGGPVDARRRGRRAPRGLRRCPRAHLGRLPAGHRRGRRLPRVRRTADRRRPPGLRPRPAGRPHQRRPRHRVDPGARGPRGARLRRLA